MNSPWILKLNSVFSYYLSAHLVSQSAVSKEKPIETGARHSLYAFIASFGLISLGGRTYQFNRDWQIPHSSRSCPTSSQDTLLRSFWSWNAYKSTQIQGFSLSLSKAIHSVLHKLLHKYYVVFWSCREPPTSAISSSFKTGRVRSCFESRQTFA